LKPITDRSNYRYKARLVACGFEQKAGLDFHETFASMVKWGTICCVMALAAHQGWKMFHLDVKIAFLNVPLTDEMYIYSLKDTSFQEKNFKCAS
jgi:hypothetical protein